MAQINKKNEAVQAPFYKNGVSLDWYTLTFVGWNFNSGDATGVTTVDVGGVSTTFFGADNTNYSLETARNPLVVALEAIQSKTSIEVIGTPVAGTNSTINIGVASLGGGYGTDDYASFGTPGAGTDFASYLQTLVRNGKTYQGYAMAGVGVTAATI